MRAPWRVAMADAPLARPGSWRAQRRGLGDPKDFLRVSSSQRPVPQRLDQMKVTAVQRCSLGSRRSDLRAVLDLHRDEPRLAGELAQKRCCSRRRTCEARAREHLPGQGSKEPTRVGEALAPAARPVRDRRRRPRERAASGPQLPTARERRASQRSRRGAAPNSRMETACTPGALTLISTRPLGSTFAGLRVSECRRATPAAAGNADASAATSRATTHCQNQVFLLTSPTSPSFRFLQRATRPVLGGRGG